MSTEPPVLVFKARLVFPVASPPINGGMVAIRGTKIVGVGTNLAGSAIRDLGNVAILPGLVNAHTHLEFSGLAAPLGAPGMAFPDWIRLVVAYRRARADAGEAEVQQGLRESVAGGTTTLGEIATCDWRQAQAGGWRLEAGGKGEDSPPPASGASPPRPPHPDTLPPGERRLGPNVHMFFELISPLADRVAGAVEAAEMFLAATPRENVTPAISPHASYTIHPQLLARLVTLSQQFRFPLAMHLAESPDEIEFLRSGSGPLRQFLSDLGAWEPRSDGRYPRVLDYLEQLASAPRALVIHGNYLDEAETQFLAARRDTMSVVYCPRTHHFFRHSAYPLARMLASGVSMALGTDSRASNPDLSLFEEMRFVAEHHPQLARSAVLALGTVCGARALGSADRVGTLEAGKAADLAIVQLGDTTADDPHEMIFAPGARVVRTWVGGRRLHDADGD